MSGVPALLLDQAAPKSATLAATVYMRVQFDRQRKSFIETDYARLLDAAHQKLNGAIVLIWDNLPTHVSWKMRRLIAARSWLTVFQLPAYAPELNPVEMGLPQCELRRSSFS